MMRFPLWILLSLLLPLEVYTLQGQDQGRSLEQDQNREQVQSQSQVQDNAQGQAQIQSQNNPRVQGQPQNQSQDNTRSQGEDQILENDQDQTQAPNLNQEPETIIITREKIDVGSIQFTGSIIHHIGDIEGADQIDFDDSEWEFVDNMWLTADQMSADWDNIRWFRVSFEVDSSMAGQPVSITHSSSGARNIWYNGRLIDTEGVVSTDIGEFEAGKIRGWTVFTLDHGDNHVIAVQAAFTDHGNYQNIGHNTGVFFVLNDPARSSNHYLDSYKFASSVTWFMIGLTLVFSVLHLFFYLYNSKQKFNLWFSLACFCFALGTWGQGQWAFNFTLSSMAQIQSLFQTMMVLTFLFMALFLRSVMNLNYPLYFKILMSLIGILSIYNLIGNLRNELLILSALIFSLEIFVIMIQAIWKKRKGAWFISGGIATFVGSIYLVVGMEMAGYTGGFNEITIFHAPYAGFIIAMVGMSLYQSKYLADLDVENERKTAELEKARELQLSLLPKKLPNRPDYSIGVAMYTATEVGGDYYDYYLKENGAMIWAMGDATGHGTEAGIVAAMSKTLFMTLAPKLPPDECLRQMSQSLKSTGVKGKYMCLGLLTVEENHVSWCAAGIPAALIIRKDLNSKIEILESKGMPLGSVTDFNYVITKASLEPGDTLLLMSDGLLEQMNGDREEFDIDRIKTILMQYRNSSPNEIIKNLKRGIDNWRGDEALHDDVSLVCLRRN